MNVYKISLMDAMAKLNITVFCELNFVKSAVYFSDLQEISMRLKGASDFYYSFFQKIEFLPVGAFMMNYVGHYDFIKVSNHTGPVSRILNTLDAKELTSKDVLPFHMRYTDEDSMHLITGLARLESKTDGFFHLVDLCLPNKLIRKVPQRIAYVGDILDSYDRDHKQSLRDIVRLEGYNYNQFQRDCKDYFGDTFYSFLLKLKMMEAVADIIFTERSLKEIAFKNKFLDYANMYKTFVRYGLNLSKIPRLAYL